MFAHRYVPCEGVSLKYVGRLQLFHSYMTYILNINTYISTYLTSHTTKKSRKADRKVDWGESINPYFQLRRRIRTWDVVFLHLLTALHIHLHLSFFCSNTLHHYIILVYRPLFISLSLEVNEELFKNWETAAYCFHDIITHVCVSSLIVRLQKNIAKGTTDPRIEFILPK